MIKLDTPSVVIRGTGILLILIGLSGVLGGIYAVKQIYDYDFESAGTAGVETSILDVSTGLGKNKQDVDTSLTNTSSNLKAASKSLVEAGVEMESTSQKLESSSANLKESAEQLESASSMNSDAGEDLKDAYGKLDDWSDSYSSNGSPLPQKTKFDAGVLKIKEASNKLEVMADELKSTSENLEKSANDLDTASVELHESSEKIKNAGENLNKSSENLRKFKISLVGMLGDIATPLEDLSSGSIANIGSNVKTGAYAFVGYLIFLHLILILLGIVLIVIDVNLSYPLM